MSSPTPFSITPKAVAFLGRATEFERKEAGLDPGSHFEVKNAQEEITDSYTCYVSDVRDDENGPTTLMHYAASEGK